MVVEGVYIVFCLLLAYANQRRISYDLVIYHGINGLLHAIFWVVALIITKSWFPACVLPFLGRLFFDAGLNVMRHLPLDYVARNPKSWIDKIEKSIFGNDGILPKLIYLIIIIGLNVLHYVTT
jgi:hypothetical protein